MPELSSKFSSKLSSSDKWTIAGRVAGRMLGTRARKSRVIAATRQAFSATWRSLASVVHRLWHEVVGFAFICFAILGGAAANREYHKHLASGTDSSRFFAAGIFSVLFAWFGVSSFWRAYRPKNRK